MFVRVKTSPNSPRKSVQICENTRVAGKVKQRILRHVGIAHDDEELEALKQLARSIIPKLEEEIRGQKALFPPESIDSTVGAVKKVPAQFKQSLNAKEVSDVKLSDLREESRVIQGIQDIYGTLFDSLGFDKVFEAKSSNAEILRSIVLARIANPGSKRMSADYLERDFGINIPLEKIYRMMDKLHPSIEKVRRTAFQATCSIFKEKSEDSGIFWIKDMSTSDGRRLLPSYSSKRARKDAKDRQKVLDKLTNLLDKEGKPKKLISNSGYKKYTKTIGGKASINYQKVQEDAGWDGIHGVVTNSKASAVDVLQSYRRLWVIEDSFRITKHDIATRPIFHFTKERIESHIAICFIAYTLIRHAQYRIKLQQRAMSALAICQTLISVQASILRDITTRGVYILPSSMSRCAEQIYRVFGIKRSLKPRKM